MKRPTDNTTLLPKQLREELGLKDPRPKNDKRSGPALRRERRRQERTGKKAQKPVQKKRQYEDDENDDDDDKLEGGDDGSGLGSVLGESDEETTPPPSKSKAAKSVDQKAKPSLKKKASAQQSESEDEDEDEEKDEEDDEKPVPRKVSKAVQDQLDEDEAEIAALEKRLGLKKGKKPPKSFEEDGLGYLLGELDDGSGDEGRKRKREADEWLLNKRRKAQGVQLAELEGDEDDDESDGEADSLGEDYDEMDDEDALEEDDGSEFGGFDEEEEKPAPKQKENPYVAPVSKESQPNKYIPPSLRASSNSESESLTRLRRQAQGQLNKLSESNLVSILAGFEELYREHPRQDVTSTLISLLMGLICERSALQDTFMILHAGFIAAVYKVIGMDFGAELIQKIVHLLDAQGDERGKFKGKELLNLISLLSQLYNFHVIGHALMFDYIRILLQEITEDNTELLLKIIKSKFPLRCFRTRG